MKDHDTQDELNFDEPIVRRRMMQLARPTDPATSFAAAQSIVPTLRQLQTRVYDCFRAHGPMTQHQLITVYIQRYGFAPQSTIRTRCAELVTAHLLEDSGQRVRLPSGRHAVVWRVAA